MLRKVVMKPCEFTVVCTLAFPACTLGLWAADSPEALSKVMLPY